MLTVDEIAVKIKQEQRNDLTPDLFDRVKGILYKKCQKSFLANKSRFIQCGIELDDLKQECYFVFLEALKGYKPEAPEPFIAFLKYPYLRMINRLLGTLNGRENNKPLDNAVSLNTPALDNESGDGAELLDLIEDADIIPYIEQAARSERKRTVRAAVRRLQEPYREIIERYFFNGQSACVIAAALNITTAKYFNTKKRALTALRNDESLRYLGLYGSFDRLERTISMTPALYMPNWSSFMRSEPYKTAKEKARSAPSYGTAQAIIYEAYQKYNAKVVDKST